MKPLSTFLLAFLTSVLFTFLARRIATRFKIGSLPSARKIHQGFIPVLGGVGIFAGLIVGIGIAFLLKVLSVSDLSHAKYFFVGLLIIVTTGLLDDIKGLNSTQKFLGQFLASITLVVGGCVIGAFRSPDGTVLSLGWSSYPFSVMWIVLVINAVNLMDGLDGLAGGISLLSQLGFLLISVITGNTFLIILALAAMGGILGFLRYNRHPASIFMGDVGSLQLGFLLAFFSIEALKVAGSNQVYFLTSLIMVGIPITDALISFFRRLGGGEHPFKADQEHVHHRVLNLGLSHSQTVDLLYLLTFLYSTIGVLMVLYDELMGLPLFIIGLVFAVYGAWRLGYLETRSRLIIGLEEREAPTAIRPQFHWNRIWHQVTTFMSDILSVNIVLYLTYWFKFQSGMLQVLTFRSLQDYFMTPVFLTFTVGWIGLFWLNGLYSMQWDISRFDKTFRISKVITFGIIVIGFITADPDRLLSRSQISSLIFYWAMMIAFVNGFRLLVILFEKRFHIFEYSFKNTLFVGATRKAANLIQDFTTNPHMLYKVVGIVDRQAGRNIEQFEGYPILGDYNDLTELIHKHKIEEIIVTLGKPSREDLMNIIGICDRLQVVVKAPPDLGEIVSGKNPGLAGHPLVRLFPERMVIWQWLVKRFLDLVFSVVLLVCMSPLMLGLAFLINVKFKGGVMVKQPIFGKNGEIFQMHLFRITHSTSMEAGDYRNGINTNNLTRIGLFVFKKNLYKLPQLLNILKGEMSIVGPRPESIEWYRENQNKFQFLHRRILVRPGITGLAQVKYRYESSQKSLIERLKYDIFYTENISINLDLRIILRSILLFLSIPNRQS
jgi:UDP-GlcNAc:undecaprenyl-phosphate GlcNAc-1-phosphate transferase